VSFRQERQEIGQQRIVAVRGFDEDLCFPGRRRARLQFADGRLSRGGDYGQVTGEADPLPLETGCHEGQENR